MQHARSHQFGRLVWEAPKRLAQSRPVEVSAAQLFQQVRGEEPIASIASQESHIGQLLLRRLTPDLEVPTACLHRLSGPAERKRDLGTYEQLAGLDVHHQRNQTLAKDQKVRHMTPHLPVHLRSDQKGLGEDGTLVTRKVCIQQARKLQPRLVDHVSTHRRGPICPRVVLLSVTPAERPPRSQGLQVIDACVRPGRRHDRTIGTAHAH